MGARGGRGLGVEEGEVVVVVQMAVLQGGVVV